MIPAKIEADRSLLRASIAAASPIKQSGPLVKAALVAAGVALLAEVDAAILAAEGSLDSADPTGYPGSLAAILNALATAANDQGTLTDMRGTIGRAVFNLRQA